MLRSRQAVIAALGGALVVALIATGRISRNETIAYVVLIPAVLLHELAKRIASRLLVDRASGASGHPSLSLRATIDPIGTLLVRALLLLGGVGLFGWARRSVTPATGLRWRRDIPVLVALTGVVVSLLMLIPAALIFSAAQGSSLEAGRPLLATVAYFFGLANLWIGLVNLIPIPPLDGCVVLERFLPTRAWPRYLKVRPYLLAGFIGVIFIDVSLHFGIVNSVTIALSNLWGSILGL